MLAMNKPTEADKKKAEEIVRKITIDLPPSCSKPCCKPDENPRYISTAADWKELRGNIAQALSDLRAELAPTQDNRELAEKVMRKMKNDALFRKSIEVETEAGKVIGAEYSIDPTDYIAQALTAKDKEHSATLERVRKDMAWHRKGPMAEIELPAPHHKMRHDDYCFAYNQAVDDLLAAVNRAINPNDQATNRE